jgi:hypothetical protein
VLHDVTNNERPEVWAIKRARPSIRVQLDGFFVLDFQCQQQELPIFRMLALSWVIEAMFVFIFSLAFDEMKLTRW